MDAEAKISNKNPSKTSYSLPLRLLHKVWHFFATSPFFWGQQQNHIGLSIGHKNVIAVELDKQDEVPKIVRFSIREVLTDTENYLPELLKEMFRTDSLSTNFVAASLSGKSVIVRFVKFLKMHKKDLRSALEYEAEKYIPFDLEQVFMDFAILEQDENSKHLDIALVVAKRECVTDLLRVCKEAELVLKAIDIDSLACFNTFVFSYPEESKKTCALINIGAKVTNLLICTGGQPSFCRDVFFGGEDVSAGLSKKMNITYEDADKVKYDFNNRADEEKKVYFRELISYLLTEIKLSIDYFIKQNQGGQIEKIYITGGTSEIDYLLQVFEDVLGVRTERMDPLRNIMIDDSIDNQLVNKYLASLAVPIGLALR